MTNLKDDANASNASNVGAAPGTEPEVDDENLTGEQKMANARANVKSLLGKQKEE